MSSHGTCHPLDKQKRHANAGNVFRTTRQSPCCAAFVRPPEKKRKQFPKVTTTLCQQQLWFTRWNGRTKKKPTNYTKWESLHGKNRNMPVSFLLFGRGAPLPSSAWSFHKKESSGREQIELLLRIALSLLCNNGIRICINKCTSATPKDLTKCQTPHAVSALNFIREFKDLEILRCCLERSLISINFSLLEIVLPSRPPPSTNLSLDSPCEKFALVDHDHVRKLFLTSGEALVDHCLQFDGDAFPRTRFLSVLNIQNFGPCIAPNSSDNFHQTICQHRTIQYDCVDDGLPEFQLFVLRESQINPIYCIVHSSPVQFVWVR